MSFQNITINVTNFNNQPFVRTLTAELLSNGQLATGSNLIRWTFPTSFAYATNPAGQLYPMNSAVQASQFNTLYFYFTASSYDFLTTGFTLCSLNITAQSLSQPTLAVVATTATNILFDTFPNIDLTLFLNYENSNANDYFYRLTSNNPFSANVRVESSQFDLLTSLSGDYFNSWYTLNNTDTKISIPSSLYLFDRPIINLSSVQFYFSAYNAPNSLSSWYTSHTVEKGLTAKFVPYFLSADFIAYPFTYFDNTTLELLSVDETNFQTQSPGLCFYGEGHTERVYLSGQFSNSIQDYVWRINNSTTTYGIVKDTINLNKGYALISTEPEEAVFLPISLQVTDSIFTSSDPVYFFNDTTGFRTYYPYYTTTVDFFGRDIATSPFKQSLEIRPYLTTFFGILNTGIPNNADVIFLPLNGTPVQFTGRFEILLTELVDCLDKYNIVWKWSNFETDIVRFLGTFEQGNMFEESDIIFIQDLTGVEQPTPLFAEQYLNTGRPVTLTFLSGVSLSSDPTFTAIPSGIYTIEQPLLNFAFTVSSSVTQAASGFVLVEVDRTPLSLFVGPSSWGTVFCSGDFSKKWRNEGLEDLLKTFPGIYEYSSPNWDLSATTVLKSWADPTITYVSGSPISFHPYQLQLLGFGGDTIEKAGFATSYYEDTFLTLGANQTVTVAITSGVYDARTLEFLSAGDWSPRAATISESEDFTSFQPPLITLYTPNRFVEINTPIKIYNNSLRLTRAVTAIEVSLDDVAGEVLFLTGDQIQSDFIISYSTPGAKTITVTGYPRFYIGSYKTVFKDIIQVVETYDQIFPDTYYTPESILENLPWKEQPVVGSNDWVVADNINSCIKMFDDNLKYLDNRSKIYQESFNDYFGWLGPQPTVIENITACPLWTWEDLDCLSDDNLYNLSWTALMSAGINPDINITGEFAFCSTWEQQACPSEQFAPTCLEKYCVEWNWKSRKEDNTVLPITWKEARITGLYPKRWYFEPCETIENINCDSGVWNVNIQELDRFYDPIDICYTQNRCRYTGITSRNNILYLSQKTIIKLLDASQRATFFDLQGTLDGATPFVGIVRIALDKENKLYILDKALSKISVYIYDFNAPSEKWTLFTTWGGIGGASSTTRFNSPTDLHIDQNDNIWVTDTGNNVVKQFTNTGTWIRTIRDDVFQTSKPISVAVDSNYNVHVATTTEIRVYSYTGEFLYNYIPTKLTGNIVKIQTNYSREIIYIATKTQVIRHFRNGVYSGTIVESKQCVDSITDLYHDEFRNLLITTSNKVLKYSDLMTLQSTKGSLPDTYWSLNDLLINEEEFIQNWVYTKCLQRVWDNIEFFRNTIFYQDSGCKEYTDLIHNKEKIIIGQNEIVTSTAVNRVLGYLWDNFNSLLKYFDPQCK